MHKKIMYLLLFFSSFIQAQNDVIKGKIVDENNETLFGANVYWLNTNIGVVTNENGEFTIKKSDETVSLVVSYIGFNTKKIEVIDDSFLTIQLKSVEELSTVTVSKSLKKYRTFFI